MGADMTFNETNNRIAEFQEKIASLPIGSITKKTVNGKTYFYHRFTENKKRREKFIPAQDLDDLKAKIDLRKKLEKEIKDLKKQLDVEDLSSLQESGFITNILMGEDLRLFARSVRTYKKRECFNQLYDYIYGDFKDKVLILYGLRRTGKTTMIRQIFADMQKSDLACSAFIQITAKNSLAEVNHDLKILQKQGIKYVFLDEVTLIPLEP